MDEREKWENLLPGARAWIETPTCL